jgi:hypothetical protein
MAWVVLIPLYGHKQAIAKLFLNDLKKNMPENNIFRRRLAWHPFPSSSGRSIASVSGENKSLPKFKNFIRRVLSFVNVFFKIIWSGG